MKKRATILGFVIVAIGCFCLTLLSRAQTPGAAQRYEVAMIKWDGPDKLQLITPQKSEFVRVFKTGAQLPPDIHDEEFCLNWGANKLAQDGWEPVNLNATRILMRRPVR
jgi:hypothetical protein